MIEHDFEDTLAFVCAMYAVDVDEVMSRNRARRYAYARGMVAILMREKRYSYPEIGLLMGKRAHTSVMRMVRLGKKVVDHALRHFMSEEEIERAERLADEARREAEQIRSREIAAAEEAVSNVIVLRPEFKHYDRECHITRKWMHAVYRMQTVEPERKEAVWKDEMLRLFPFTAETPTALYGQAQAS